MKGYVTIRMEAPHLSYHHDIFGGHWPSAREDGEMMSQNHEIIWVESS